jgi:hypothetical protein
MFFESCENEVNWDAAGDAARTNATKRPGRSQEALAVDRRTAFLSNRMVGKE